MHPYLKIGMVVLCVVDQLLEIKINVDQYHGCFYMSTNRSCKFLIIDENVLSGYIHSLSPVKKVNKRYFVYHLIKKEFEHVGKTKLPVNNKHQETD